MAETPVSMDQLKWSMFETLAKSVEGQEPSWKNFLTRNSLKLEDIVADLEHLEKLEDAPAWFKEVASQVADMWFDPKSFESKELYEKMGILTFKKYLPTGEVLSKVGYKLGEKKGFVSGSSETALNHYELFTRIYEGFHVIILVYFVLTMNTLLSHITEGHLDKTLQGSGIILVNIYAVLLQRYNRLRLYGAIHKARRREEKRLSHSVPQNEEVS